MDAKLEFSLGDLEEVYMSSFVPLDEEDQYPKSRKSHMA